MSIPFVKIKLGNRYILEKILKQEWYLGDEYSGHIILLDKITTADGSAGLQVLTVMIRNHMSLYELSYVMV